MAAVESLRIELSRVSLLDTGYGESAKWDDLTRRCVVDYRLCDGDGPVAGGVGNAFPALVEIANWIASGGGDAELAIADDFTLCIRPGADPVHWQVAVPEFSMEVACGRNALFAFVLALFSEIAAASKSLGFDPYPYLHSHMQDSGIPPMV
jgi:hypothetical protein